MQKKMLIVVGVALLFAGYVAAHDTTQVEVLIVQQDFDFDAAQRNEVIDDLDFEDDLNSYISIEEPVMPKQTRGSKLLNQVSPYALPLMMQVQRIWNSLAAVSAALKIKILNRLGYSPSIKPSNAEHND